MAEKPDGVTVTLEAMYEILLTLKPLPDRLDVIVAQVNKALDDQNTDIRNLRAEVQDHVKTRDEKIKELRVENKEIRDENKELRMELVELRGKIKPSAPITAIAAIIISAFVASITFIKEIAN